MHLWLRAESKPFEARSPLTPAGVSTLLQAGHRVTVERSATRAFPDADFADLAGATLVEAGSWPDAPHEAIILGLKELPPPTGEHDRQLVHRHVMFAHAYKQQAGWRDVLGRFVDGGGTLYDLEVLEDRGRRVAAFGYWAGYAGAAVAAMVYARRTQALAPFGSRAALVESLARSLEGVPPPGMLVIGARGRCGTGALALAADLGLPATGWDLEETRDGGPFPAILEHELFVNAVLLGGPLPPFLTRELLAGPRRLRVISDVSCDPASPYNPLPIYDEPTTFAAPARRLADEPPLDLVAIDHLPSLLPRESSEDFAAQLLPHLLAFGSPVWDGAARVFQEKTMPLRSM